MATEVQNPEGHAPITATSANPYHFNFSDFLRREYRFGLAPDRPACKAYLQGHCPQGNNCPDKHPATGPYGSLVCKHWLRGLCKKGEQCEFLHEYNLRRMPECQWYARSQTCGNGDDCLYLHIDPESKRPACPHYDRGFCPLGPICALKHIKKDKLCPFYLAGFCPEGRDCKNGAHPRFPTDLKKPEVRVEKTKEQLEQERYERELQREKEEEQERERDDRHSLSGGGFKSRGNWGPRKKRGQQRRGRGGY
ncbi:hypothetical protein M011DRAFT_417078 [Sporormia fimetaria CBS 119925]|uniref:mRNA 3'-end-processing protein n=1 Tax=Sporormia fimetaria CBS 119925 TaxID=1340428 RepID=A0A6A6VNQ6_9PLEO|nr:hypothetical protein M011DRAFT_417078 [Sporormia fimetaria CBS 119925]